MYSNYFIQTMYNIIIKLNKDFNISDCKLFKFEQFFIRILFFNLKHI